VSGRRRDRVDLAPEVVLDLVAIARHVESWTADRALADRTAAAIRAYLGGFASVPHRGTRRDDLMPELRIVPFKRRTAIAFTVDDVARTVRVIRVFYGGQDYEAVLRSPPD
jgi:toxin ParE1/3/4